MEEILLKKNKLINAPVGVSMLPLLRSNRDVVILENNLKPEIYDVVLYIRDNGKYILHRIIDVDSNSYVMCGDNQFIKELGIKQEQILAVMTGFYRDKKYYESSNRYYQWYVKVWCYSLKLRRVFIVILKIYRKIRQFIYVSRK